MNRHTNKSPPTPGKTSTSIEKCKALKFILAPARLRAEKIYLGSEKSLRTDTWFNRKSFSVKTNT